MNAFFMLPLHLSRHPRLCLFFAFEFEHQEESREKETVEKGIYQFYGHSWRQSGGWSAGKENKICLHSKPLSKYKQLREIRIAERKQMEDELFGEVWLVFTSSWLHYM